MYRRNFFLVITAVVLALGAVVPALAQTGELRGKVEMTQADGTKVPAVQAQVDVYRTDLPGKYEVKTNRRGEFVFAGLPYVGDYLVVVSYTGAQPTWQDRVKVGRGNEIGFVLQAGDGKRPTLTEVKAAMSASGGDPGPESASDRAKREELLKKNAEIMAANKKAGEINEIIGRTFRAGNEAAKAGNFDEAIRQFDEGLSADPEQPALLTNKANALKLRGVNKYNEALKATDDAAKTAGFAAAKADFTAAKDTSAKAVELIKKHAAAATDPTEQQRQNLNKLAALNVYAETMRLFVTKVDGSQADAGAAAFQEYLAIETDPERKAKAEQALAQMLFDANAFDKALLQYQKILETNPDNLDALLRSGMALFNIGAMNNDKAKYQEAANYLARFVEKAPDTDAMKADAKAILENLKAQENVKPEKTAAPARRRRP
jgi:tetratricopeptide (TPR) repeat protein